MTAAESQKIDSLINIARTVRADVLKMLTAAGSGHTAGSLGMVEIFVAMYFHLLNHRSEEPDWPDRDRLLLSNGHICPARYATMARAGYFPVEELATLRKLGSRLQGHPDLGTIPGLESTSGPLGLGLGQAAGIGLAARLDKKENIVYALTSDGEHQCGNVWESAMLAAHYKIDNLVQIIDRNKIQIDGQTEETMALEPLPEKYKEFGWAVFETDGHDFEQIIGTVEAAKKISGQPAVIIANTVPGKGVPEIENDAAWHGIAPNEEQLSRFLEVVKKS